MNKTQRTQNRQNAKDLHWNALSKIKCPNCGELGPHWVSIPVSLETIIESKQISHGFWTCPMYYDAAGRRISPESQRALDEKIALSKVGTDENRVP